MSDKSGNKPLTPSLLKPDKPKTMIDIYYDKVKKLPYVRVREKNDMQ